MNTPKYHVEIIVKQALDEHWSEWFAGLALARAAENGPTTISGPVADQPAVHGLLATVRDLNLSLIAVQIHEILS